MQNQLSNLMGNYNPKRDPQPDKKDVQRFKDFLRHKYVDKRFEQDNKASDSSSDEEVRKAKKAAKKEKKDRKKKKRVSSSDEESDEIVVPAKAVVEKPSSRKLGAPPGFKPVPVTQVAAKVE